MNRETGTHGIFIINCVDLPHGIDDFKELRFADKGVFRVGKTMRPHDDELFFIEEGSFCRAKVEDVKEFLGGSDVI